MSRHRFARSWHVAAPADDVFDTLVATGEWPLWWPHLADVGDADDDGFRRYVVRAPVGYRLAILGRIVDAERPARVVAELAGDLRGEGRIALRPDGAPGSPATVVDYEIDVTVGLRWVRAAARLAGPVLAWSHDRVVAGAFRGLGRRLGADVRPLDP